MYDGVGHSNKPKPSFEMSLAREAGKSSHCNQALHRVYVLMHAHTHTYTHTLNSLAGFMPEGMPPDAVKVIAPIMEKVSTT